MSVGRFSQSFVSVLVFSVLFISSEGKSLKVGPLELGVPVNFEDDALYRDCGDVRDAGYTTDGVYQFHTVNSSTPFQVNCAFRKDPSGNYLGETIMLQRLNNDLRFEQSYLAYMAGFEAGDNFWLGLDKIADITSKQSASLEVRLYDWSDRYYVGQYSKFRVFPKDFNYKLEISGFTTTGKQPQLHDALRNNNGAEFYSSDRPDQFNCAPRMGGGWWYMGSEYCTSSLPTGYIYPGKYYDHGGAWRGMYWEGPYKQDYSFRKLWLVIVYPY